MRRLIGVFALTFVSTAQPLPAAVDRTDAVVDSLASESAAEVVGVLQDNAGLTAPLDKQIDAFVLGGARRSEEVRLRLGPVSARGRRVNGENTGWLMFKSVGRVRRLIVGGVRMSVGNALILGARRTALSLPAAPSRDAVRVSPSASVWRRRTGMAAMVGAGPVRVAGIGWKGDDSGAFAALESRTAAWTFGAVAGRARSGRGGGQRSGATVFAGWRSSAASARAEAGAWDGRPVALVRVAVRSSARWSTEFGVGPGGSRLGDVTASPAADGDIVRAAVRRSGRLGSLRHEVRLWSALDRTAARERRTRRLELRLAAPAGSGRVEFDARASHLDVVTHARAPVETAPRLTEDTDMRFRCRYHTDGRDGLRQRFGVWVLPGPHGTGVVTEWRVTWLSRRGELALQAANAALAPSQLAMVGRPGLARYESLAVLTGNEADLSGRVRVTRGPLTIAVHAGVSTGLAARVLAMLSVGS